MLADNDIFEIVKRVKEEVEKENLVSTKPISTVKDKVKRIVDEYNKEMNNVYKYNEKNEIVDKQKNIIEEKTSVDQIVFIGDPHCGSRLGLCPPKKIRMDSGTYIEPSPNQCKMWEKFDYFWKEWVPERTKGKPFVIGFMGDICDGHPHNSKTSFSDNINDQKHIALEALASVIEQSVGVFAVSGTEAHTGKSGEDEENIMEFLNEQTGKVYQSKEGRYAPHEWWIKIGGEDGALIHMMHHIGITGSSHARTTAITKEVMELIIAAQKWGEQHPDIVVRAHRHTSCKVGIPSSRGDVIGFITPAWQLKTPYAYKVIGGRTDLPEIGGGYAKAGDVIHHYVDSIVWGVKRDKPYIVTL